ncbi:MAG TPA: RsiV family protein [Rhabdochlamydiaceae bacterium]|jgi:hypothetical protein
MILIRIGWLIAIVLMFSGCRDQSVVLLDDLSLLKKQFIAEVLEGAVDECPFNLSYDLRTIFYSKELVSLFGEFHQYTHLPHGWAKYEGRTFYKKNGKFTPLVLNDLICGDDGWKFIREYCENALRADPCSYFSGEQPLRTVLEREDLSTFILDDQSLILVFQPYTVAEGVDGPPIVRVRWEDLQKAIVSSHPVNAILNDAISSKCFVSSWDENSRERSFSEYDASIRKTASNPNL